MKKIYLSILLLAVTIGVAFSQVPNAFNYQAVVRNSSGEILANKTVSFRISFLKNSESGAVAYSETHSLSTNDFGLVNFKIGKGTKLSGDFSPSDWGEVIFTKVEFDPEGGNTFSHLATTKLSSVPFAFVAQTVVNDKVDDADADPANEIQTLSLNGTLLELSNGGGSVTLPASGGSGGDNWGAQTVKTNATLTGDGTTAHPLSVVADGDGDDSNELQTLALSGNDLTLSDGGGTVALPSSPWNETVSQINYVGSKNVYIGEGGGSALKTKSGSKANPPKFEVNTGSRSAIGIYNESSTYSTFDVWNEEGVAARFGSNANIPTVIFDNADVGPAAEFRNKIVIKDGTQGDGKVLTSDADGNTSWQAPAAGGGSSLWTESGSNVYRSSGKVGIGIAPVGSIKLHVDTNDDYIAIRAENKSSTYGSIYLKNKGSGPAADLRSPIKIADGTQGADKILTSDADGLATWESNPWKKNSSVYESIYTMEKVSIGAVHASVPVGFYVNGDDTYAAVIANNSSSPALYVDNHGTGLAAQFLDDVKIDGEVNTNNTGDANMLPIAYGKVSGGSLYGQTGNVTSVEKGGTGKYKIKISGFVAYNTTVITATKMGGDPWVVVQVGSFGSGYIKINVYDIKNDAYIDGSFSFVVYQK